VTTTANPPMLSTLDFLEVVRLTPLVSIDLIITDAQGRVLVGRRLNRPARGVWFVPGGRIRKDESLRDAFRRIASDELGLADPTLDIASFRGVFEHCYEDNFAGATGISTHYVVLAYSLPAEQAFGVERFEQHSDYAWMPPAELLARTDVHDNTKAYFR
jgi:colanic acid biosynthesis protein WcaH